MVRKKVRRLVVSFLSVMRSLLSGGHGERLRLDPDEGAAERSHRPIELGRGRFLEILEKASGPWRDVVLEETLLRGEIGLAAEGAGDEPRHHLGQRADMVLGLGDAVVRG